MEKELKKPKSKGKITSLSSERIKARAFPMHHLKKSFDKGKKESPKSDDTD